MARYINEDDLLVKIMDLNLDHVQGDDGRELCQIIQAIPTADVREIVLCKDCRFNTGENKCLHPDSIIRIPADDDYCSYGERRRCECI